jgi:hypothetical protein
MCFLQNGRAALDMVKHKDIEGRVLLMAAIENWNSRLVENDNSYEEEVL